MTQPPQGITTDVMSKRNKSKARFLVREQVDGDLFNELARYLAYVLEAPLRFEG